MVRVQVPVLLSRIQRADSVDICAGVAAIGLRVAVSQADVIEGHTRRNFSREIQTRSASFSGADTVPFPQIAADDNFRFFDVRTDLKNVNIITRAIIEGEPQADNDRAAVAEAEVAGGLCRVAGIGQTQGEVWILVVRIAGPGIAMIEADPMSASTADAAVTYANYAFCIGKLGDLAGARKYLTIAKKKGCNEQTLDYFCKALKIRV